MVDMLDYMATSLLFHYPNYLILDKGKIFVIRTKLARDKGFVGYKEITSDTMVELN